MLQKWPNQVCEIDNCFCLDAEEILDDRVGLLLEGSADSLDDDDESFSDFDECRKVSAQEKKRHWTARTLVSFSSQLCVVMK